jgi:copper chaperone CopZ
VYPVSDQAMVRRGLWIGAIGLGLVIAALVLASSVTRDRLLDRAASWAWSATPAALPAGTADGTLVLEGMGFTCALCAAADAAKVRSLPGVTAAEADLARDQLFVRYDPALTSRDWLVDSITELGYRPRCVREP